ncbi:MAG: hypothetical protein IIW83_03300, partial [Clostridia bacterium]|nr:hypothetical protein [Clostridia bacterium]
MMGTDVGGMYRSDDGGVHWTPSAIGFEGCGCTGFAYDPNNINKVIGIGVNSWGCPQNGIYMSNDKGLTWEAIMQTRICGFRDLRNQVAFDETSFDEKIGGSAVVYWAREGSRNNFDRDDTEKDPGIYKSTDGGYTWAKLKNTEMMGDACIYVHREKGWLFVICPTGFYRSKDKGETFEKLSDEMFTFGDCIRSYPDRIYATTQKGLLVSYDCGDNFTYVETSTFPDGWPSALRVSPVNPDLMVMQDDRLTACGSWSMPVYYTADGGKTWAQSERNAEASWVPANDDQTKFYWSPVEEKKVLITWCFICASTDGGKTFVWQNAGYNGLCPGGKICWNVNDPNYMEISSQDYNGGYTTDAGKTWNYVCWSGYRWGGWTYGGYTFNDDVTFCGLADRMFGETKIAVTYDGGKTIVKTGMDIHGSQISCGVPGNENVAFIGDCVTRDMGKTFEYMDGCTGVHAYDYTGKTLFGTLWDSTIVMSDDEGVTWKQVFTAEGARIGDMAYNYKNGYLYFLNWGELCKIKLDGSGFTKLSYPSKHAWTLCVDPENPDIVYIGCYSHAEFGMPNVLRSLDGGETWTVLNRLPNDGRSGPDGGKQPVQIRINPLTRELFVLCGCRGVWKIKCCPPDAK